jgi:hypothetical protein
LLVGCWDGKFESGTAPHAWTGSVAIFEQYLKEGGRPVKYGQCWVFSAVVVTGEFFTRMCRRSRLLQSKSVFNGGKHMMFLYLFNKNTETLIDASKEVGLEVHVEKTKYM